MPAYPDLDGRSGVRWYDVTADQIIVTFADGHAYRYDHARPGPAAVDRMKLLAAAGRGLNGYISRAVRSNYAAKLR